MAHIEVFQRYLHIIHILLKRPAELSEIKNYLDLQSEQDGQHYSLSNRTFLRDKEAILSIFKLEIVYDAHDKKYRIEEGMDSVPAKLVEAFNTFNALQFSHTIPNAIQLEQLTTKGIAHFRPLLQAITQQREVVLDYKKFDSDISEKRIVRPLLLKEFRKRWYLIAIDQKKSEIRIFGLDRMEGFEFSTKKFKAAQEVKILDFFKHSFGIVYLENVEIEKVELQFDSSTAPYIKTLPLHASQIILEENEEGLKVQLDLIISPDFVSELLYYGSKVKVLKPESLRDAVKSALKLALKHYI